MHKPFECRVFSRVAICVGKNAERTNYTTMLYLSACLVAWANTTNKKKKKNRTARKCAVCLSSRIFRLCAHTQSVCQIV